METKNDRLFWRADAILDRKANGFGEPILWHLAFRGHGEALLMLANQMTSTGTRQELGRIQDAFSPIGMTYRAYQRGVPYAARHMALSRFNIGDLAGYRRWIRLAARAGMPDDVKDARRFETRLPHNLARKIGRLRPYRRDGS